MTIRSIEQLLALADSEFPDNVSGLITPAHLRDYLKDFVSTIAPAFGVIQLTTPVTLNLSTTPQVVKPFDSALVLTPPYFSADLPNGTLTRSLAGVPKTATIFTVSGDISASGGIDVEIRLFKDGIATPFFQRVSSSSLTNNEPYDFSAFDIASANAVYDLRVSVPSGTNNVTFNQISLTGYSVPVRSFV